jgi:hypothetical protein
MKIEYLIKPVSVLGLTLTVSSCSFFQRGPSDQEIDNRAYKRGFEAAQAHLARMQAHEEQARLAAPPEPLPKKYHEVPVPAYRDADGILREEQTVIIETIEPQSHY